MSIFTPVFLFPRDLKLRHDTNRLRITRESHLIRSNTKLYQALFQNSKDSFYTVNGLRNILHCKVISQYHLWPLGGSGAYVITFWQKNKTHLMPAGGPCMNYIPLKKYFNLNKWHSMAPSVRVTVILFPLIYSLCKKSNPCTIFPLWFDQRINKRFKWGQELFCFMASHYCQDRILIPRCQCLYALLILHLPKRHQRVWTVYFSWPLSYSSSSSLWTHIRSHMILWH